MKCHIYSYLPLPRVRRRPVGVVLLVVQRSVVLAGRRSLLGLLATGGSSSSLKVRRAVKGLLRAVDRSIAAVSARRLIARVLGDDVKGVDQARQETQAAQRHVDEKVGRTDASSHRHGDWREENGHNDEKEVVAAHVCSGVVWVWGVGVFVSLRGQVVCFGVVLWRNTASGS